MFLAERALNTLAAAVTDWSEDKSKREALVQIGRSVLIKWLLSRALDDRHTLEQTEAEHALLNLLADGEGGDFCLHLLAGSRINCLTTNTTLLCCWWWLAHLSGI